MGRREGGGRGGEIKTKKVIFDRFKNRHAC
jgi:hypothetical protein